MADRIALELQLQTARLLLDVLEQQAASFGALHVPAHSVIWEELPAAKVITTAPPTITSRH